MQRSTFIGMLLVIGVSLGASGCISFAGPNDIRKQIAAAEHVTLEQEEAITVGPLGVAIAKAFVADKVPGGLKGLSSVQYGQYQIQPRDGSAWADVRLHRLELEGLERIARIREDGEEIVVMAGGRGETIDHMVVVMREQDELNIVRIRGDFEKIIESLLESDLLQAEMGLGFVAGRDADEQPHVVVHASID